MFSLRNPSIESKARRELLGIAGLVLVSHAVVVVVAYCIQTPLVTEKPLIEPPTLIAMMQFEPQPAQASAPIAAPVPKVVPPPASVAKTILKPVITPPPTPLPPVPSPPDLTEPKPPTPLPDTPPAVLTAQAITQPSIASVLPNTTASQPAPSASSSATSVAAQPAAAPVVAPVQAPIKTSAIFNAAYLNNPAPAYPNISRLRGEVGTTLLRVQISPEGKAATVQLSRSSGSSKLDEAAIKAVSAWNFIPAKTDGIAISSWVTIPLEFKLN